MCKNINDNNDNNWKILVPIKLNKREGFKAAARPFAEEEQKIERLKALCLNQRSKYFILYKF